MAPITVRVKKFMNNPLLQRKQFHLVVEHPSGGTPARKAIREQLAHTYNINDVNRIIVGGFATAFGGGSSSGFGRIYDSVAAAKKFERPYRLAREGIVEKKAGVARRAKKDIRVRKAKVRGTAKAKVAGGAKK